MRYLPYFNCAIFILVMNACQSQNRLKVAEYSTYGCRSCKLMTDTSAHVLNLKVDYYLSSDMFIRLNIYDPYHTAKINKMYHNGVNMHYNKLKKYLIDSMSLWERDTIIMQKNYPYLVFNKVNYLQIPMTYSDTVYYPISEYISNTRKSFTMSVYNKVIIPSAKDSIFIIDKTEVIQGPLKYVQFSNSIQRIYYLTETLEIVKEEIEPSEHNINQYCIIRDLVKITTINSRKYGRCINYDLKIQNSVYVGPF